MRRKIQGPKRNKHLKFWNHAYYTMYMQTRREGYSVEDAKDLATWYANNVAGKRR